VIKIYLSIYQLI